MPKFVVQWKYKSSYGGPFEAGEVVEVDVQTAEDVNRDSPGVLVPAPTGKAALIRMVTHALKRANEANERKYQAHEGDGTQAMTTENFGAVRLPVHRKSGGE